jgi:hypothetical protein
MNIQALAGHRTTDSNRTLWTGNRMIMATIWTGLALTVIATIVPYIDHATSNTLADHIRAGYPNNSQERIDTAQLPISCTKP